MPLPSTAAAPPRRIRPWLLATAGYAVLSCARLWPLLREAGSAVVLPGDDSLLNSWILWWNVQVVPLTAGWWNAPAFHPAGGAISFSELLLGELPITAPVQWLTGNPALAHNAAVILSFPLCALGAHALVFHLTRRHDAGLLAGLAFGFGAFRANHIGHLQMLSYYWSPVALLCLHQSLSASRRLPWLAGAAGALAMQVLCNGYSLFQLPLLIVAWILWFPRTWRERLSASGALAAGLLLLAPVLLGYRAFHAHYGFSRSYDAIRVLSTDVTDLFVAHGFNVVLGSVMPGTRTSWFPGITVTGLLLIALVVAIRGRAAVPSGRPWYRHALLAAAAAAAAVAVSFAVFGPWSLGPLTVSRLHKPISLATAAAVAYVATGPRARRVLAARSAVGFYLLSSIAFFVFSFGPEPRMFGTRVFYQPPYSLLLRLPGYDSIRAPDRMAVLATFCLVVVMALTYAQWAPALRARRALVSALLCAGLVVDGWFTVPVEALPVRGPSIDWTGVRAVVELPLLPVNDVSAMYRSIAYGVPSVNAGSGYAPQHYHVLRQALGEADLTAFDGFGEEGALGVVIDRTSPDHDRYARAAAGTDGATLLQQSARWTAYRLPLHPTPRPTFGEALAIDRVATQGATNDISEVTVGLKDVSRVSAVHWRVDAAWPFLPRAITVDTSLDGAAWVPAWQGRTTASTVRAMLESPLTAPFVVAFEPRMARFVRIRPASTEPMQSLTTDALSVH